MLRTDSDKDPALWQTTWARATADDRVLCLRHTADQDRHWIHLLRSNFIRTTTLTWLNLIRDEVVRWSSVANESSMEWRRRPM